MGDLTVCQTKKFYDTEFEAQRAASIVEAQFGEAMTAYRCKNHWHIAHEKQEEQRGMGHNYFRCPHCKKIFRRTKIKHKCKLKPRKKNV